jgi:hypothetical protein
LRHAKGKSKRDFDRVYKGGANSLKVNRIFERQATVVGLVYNEVRRTGGSRWSKENGYPIPKRPKKNPMFSNADYPYDYDE